MSAHNTGVNPATHPTNANLNLNTQYVRQADATNYGVRQYYAQYPASAYVPRASLMMAGVGAVVGGTAAAAKNIRRVREQEIDRREAIRDTASEAAGAALATGLATAAVGYMGPNSNLLSLLGTIAVATGTKYLWDGLTASVCQTDAAK